MADVQSFEDITSALGSKEADRPIYEYRLPKSLAEAMGIQTIGIVELTTQEMILAQQRSSGPSLSTGFELAKACWRRVDARRLSVGDGTADTEWGSNKPGMAKLRTLVTQAYADVHNPKDSDNEDFLASRVLRIGG